MLKSSLILGLFVHNLLKTYNIKSKKFDLALNIWFESKAFLLYLPCKRTKDMNGKANKDI